MIRQTMLLVPLLAALTLASPAQAADAGGRTILYEDAVTQLGPGLSGLQDLWVTTAELTQATRFELKPQGVCRGDWTEPESAAGRGCSR